MSFVLARYLWLEIDWNLVTGALLGALGRTEIRLLPHSLHGVEERLRAIFRVVTCARGISRARKDLFTPDIGGPIPNHNRRSFTLVVEWRLQTDLLMSTKENLHDHASTPCFKH
jgi:hypothetical protein